MGFNPFRLVHVLARVGRPLLRLFGVKRGTVPDKVAEAAEVLDPILPSSSKESQTDTSK